MKSITVVATTYFPPNDTKRRQVAEETIKTWHINMLYDGTINLHLADDGSRQQLSVEWTRGSVTRSQQKRQGVGASLNRGFAKGFETSPLVLYAVDDWALTQPFDLTPWAKLLMERQDVGMVRLGPPHPGISGKAEMFTTDWQGWGLRLDRHDFAFGHRPALYHMRMIEFYGFFEEKANALECERLYNDVFVSKPKGPDIVLALPHPWFHMDSIELSGVEPNG